MEENRKRTHCYNCYDDASGGMWAVKETRPMEKKVPVAIDNDHDSAGSSLRRRTHEEMNAEEGLVVHSRTGRSETIAHMSLA